MGVALDTAVQQALEQETGRVKRFERQESYLQRNPRTQPKASECASDRDAWNQLKARVGQPADLPDELVSSAEQSLKSLLSTAAYEKLVAVAEKLRDVAGPEVMNAMSTPIGDQTWHEQVVEQLCKGVFAIAAGADLQTALDQTGDIALVRGQSNKVALLKYDHLQGGTTPYTVQKGSYDCWVVSQGKVEQAKMNASEVQRFGLGLRDYIMT